MHYKYDCQVVESFTKCKYKKVTNENVYFYYPHPKYGDGNVFIGICLLVGVPGSLWGRGITHSPLTGPVQSPDPGPVEWVTPSPVTHPAQTP